MKKKYKLDKMDMEIVRHLWDGRTPYADIAEEVGLTTNTVRNRVNRMRDEGALQIICLVDPSTVEGHSSAFVGFKIFPDKVKTCLSQIYTLKGVVGAARVSGRFDVIAVLMFNEEHNYERFLEEELLKVDGVVSTETFFTIGGENFQLRYVL